MIGIDTLVLVAGDRNTGKSTQIRSIFTEPEMEIHHQNILNRPRRNYNNLPATFPVLSDMHLYVRLTSWHEARGNYAYVKRDITNRAPNDFRRYKVIAPAQITGTKNLPFSAEELFKQLFLDFKIRRGFLVWLSPNRVNNNPFAVSNNILRPFIENNSNASALAIDSQHNAQVTGAFRRSINSRLLCDLLFRA